MAEGSVIGHADAERENERVAKNGARGNGGTGSEIARAKGGFLAGLAAIRDGYAKARIAQQDAKAEGTYVCPWDTAENYIKRESYDLIARTLDVSGGRTAIKRLVKERHHAPEKPTFAEEPFYWGLLLIFDFDQGYSIRYKSAHVRKMSQSDRSAYAKICNYAPLLHFAYRHKVPSSHLIGFLFQLGVRPKQARMMNVNRKKHVDFFDFARKSHVPN